MGPLHLPPSLPDVIENGHRLPGPESKGASRATGGRFYLMTPRRSFTATALMFLLAWTASGQPAAGQSGPGQSGTAQAGASQQPAQQDPLNRVSPQSAILNFLDTCHANNYVRAAHYLDLSRLPALERTKRGPELARQLEQILNRDAQFDVASLSLQPEGDHGDGLAPNREQLISVKPDGKTVVLELERTALRPGLQVWRVAPDSVLLIPALAAATSESPIERHLPAALVNTTLLDTSMWRWLALAIWAIVTGLIASLAGRLAGLLGSLLKRAIPDSSGPELVQPFVRPVHLLVYAAIFQAGMQWIDPAAVPRLYLGRTVELIYALGLVWLAAGIVDLVMLRMRVTWNGAHHTISRSALPLVSRVLKVLILIVGLIGVLGSWGYNMGTLLAGLGIGGIALALAAQKTIENLFGSVAVVGDRPVYVGESCKFGDSQGTVEDIGLRSTRIRTVDRTLVTVPNGQFSSMTLENFSRRDKMLFHIKLNLRRDTTAAQVRKLLEAIRQILSKPEIEAGAIPVRFIGVGAYSLDIEISVYILTRDDTEFLTIQQELLLEILDAVAAAGTALALPTQVSMPFTGGQALDKPSEAKTVRP